MKKILALFFTMLSFSQLQGGSNIHWSSPATALSPANLNASNPQIAIDSNGNLVAAWVENGFVKSSSKHISGNWSAEVTLSSSGASSPSLVSDVNGNATAVWLESGVVKAATKTLNGNWTSSTALSLSGATSPDLAVDSAGDVVAAWARSGNVESSTKLFGGSWQTRVSISSSSAALPQVAIGGSGANKTAVIVWQGVSSSTNVVFASSKLLSGSWSAQQVISDTPYSAGYANVAVDANANAVAVWYQYNLTGSNYSNVVVQAACKPFGGSWTCSENLSEAGIRNPATLVARVAFDSTGNAIAIWNTSFDDATFNIESAMKPVRTSTWVNLTDIVASNLYAYALDVSPTAFGDVLATYMFFNGAALTIQSAESDIDAVSENTWDVATNVSQGNNNGFPRIAATVTGNVINAAVVWMNFNGSHNQIVASTGSRTLVLPPSSLTVTQSPNNYGVFTEYFNTLSWHPSSDPTVIGYLVFRNGILIGEVDANIIPLQFEDNNRVQNAAATYGVVAIDSQGSQSATATVSFP